MTPTASIIAMWLAFASLYSGLPIPPNAYPEVKLGNPGNPQWWGATEWPSGKITLSVKADECTLAHELTHWLQIKNHFDDLERPDEQKVEPPAFRVQGECYRQQGKPGYAKGSFDIANKIERGEIDCTKTPGKC